MRDTSPMVEKVFKMERYFKKGGKVTKRGARNFEM